jgi:hypothetical protein
MEGISNTLNCSSNCLPNIGNPTISGPDQICSTATYTIPTLPTGATLTWAVSSPSVSSTTSGNSITLTNLSGSYGLSTTLTATISSACGNTTINKSITLGGTYIESVSFLNGAGSEGHFCTSHSGNKFQVTTANAINPHHFEVRMYSYPSLTLVHSQTYYGQLSDLNFMGVPNTYYAFEIRAYDSNCGYSDWFGYEIEFKDCSMEEMAYRIFPNPASTEINISLGDGSSNKNIAKHGKKEYEVLLFDIKGHLKLKTKSKNLEAKLNTENLPAKNYFIHIRREGEKEIIKKQVIIRN